MTKHWPLLLSIAFILLFSVATSILNALEIQSIKDELKAPKRVEIASNGSIHSWPIDNDKIRIVEDTK